jgi:hypothetical protein
MNVMQFCRKYNVSSVPVYNLIKKNKIDKDIHYTIKYDLHQKKVNILEPDHVYQTILKNSNTIRRKHGLQKSNNNL